MGNRKRFVPGRGQGKKTIVEALKPQVDMTKIDGTILLKKGDIREYDFDLQASLRTGQQKKALANLLRSRFIKLTVTDQEEVVDTGPSHGAQTSVDSTPELESQESAPSQEPPKLDESYSSVDDPEESSSSSEELEDEKAETDVTPSVESREEDEAESAPSAGAEDAPADGEGSAGSADEGAADEPVADDAGDEHAEERAEPDAGAADGVDEEAIEREVTRKFDALNAIHGLGLKTVEKLIQLPNPATHESVSSVPRIKQTMIPKILEILNS